MKKVVDHPVPVIKRVSGGGTVIVDHDTVFVTLICMEGAIQGLPLFPRPIASWTEKFYKPVFKDNDGFHLRESGIYDIIGFMYVCDLFMNTWSNVCKASRFQFLKLGIHKIWIFIYTCKSCMYRLVLLS